MYVHGSVQMVPLSSMEDILILGVYILIEGFPYSCTCISCIANFYMYLRVLCSICMWYLCVYLPYLVTPVADLLSVSKPQKHSFHLELD